MAADPLDELVQFLNPEARIDLKHIALDHLVGLSGNEDGIDTLLSKEKIIQSIISLTDDKVDEIAKNALLILVNITASTKGVIELLKFKSEEHQNIIKILIGYVLNTEKKHADAACMVLSNITRVESEVETILNIFQPYLNDILYAFVNTDYNKKGSNLNYIGPIISNLSCCYLVRKWLTEENPHIPLIKILPFCNYELSNIRRGAAIGTIRNLSFDADFHDFLISHDLELLTYLLTPIMGNEEYCDEEMDTLPISLQYLPKEKQRDNDVDIRRMILETLNKLCLRRNGREFLRENGVYYILREYHKWEKDPKVRLSCENVIDILIQKEDEVGAEDFSTVDVPDHLKEKFEKMDEDYIKDN